MKKKGICYVCGCTNDEPCVAPGVQPCSWENIKQTLCTYCAPLSNAERKAKRAKALKELVKWHKSILAEAKELAIRIEVLRTSCGIGSIARDAAGTASVIATRKNARNAGAI